VYISLLGGIGPEAEEFFDYDEYYNLLNKDEAEMLKFGAKIPAAVAGGNTLSQKHGGASQWGLDGTKTTPSYPGESTINKMYPHNTYVSPKYSPPYSKEWINFSVQKF
jgi:hypothetical protein